MSNNESEMSPISNNWEYLADHKKDNVLSGDELKAMDNTTVWDYMHEQMRKYGDKVAQVDPKTGSSLTFSEILSESQLLSEALAERGAKPGQVAAIISENNIDFIWVLLGCSKTGMATVLIDPSSSPREMEHLLNMTKPRFVFCPTPKSFYMLEPAVTEQIEQIFYYNCKDEDILSKTVLLSEFMKNPLKKNWSPFNLSTIKEEMKSASNSSLHETQSSAADVNNDVNVHNSEQDISTGQNVKEDIIKPQEDSVSCQDDVKDVVLILCSSGSSGPPKGVMLTHKNVVSALMTSENYMDQDDVVLGLMPFHHAYGLFLMMMSVCRGATVVVLPKFNIDHFLSTIASHKVTHLFLVPSILILMCKKNTIDKKHMESVRHIWTGAASITWTTQQQVVDNLGDGVTLHHSYGLTESTFTMFTCVSVSDRPGSVGRITSGMHVKVIEVGTNNLLGPDEKGELCFRGPLISKGYLNNDEATKEAIDEEGWLHTGDLGYYDSDGYFYIVERFKEMIKYQGHQVSPSELESLLLKHPAIQDAAVYGKNHEVYGELPTALYVVKSGEELNSVQVQKYIADQVSPHKRLNGGAKQVDIIPKTSSGKIQRRKLSKLGSAEQQAENKKSFCCIL